MWPPSTRRAPSSSQWSRRWRLSPMDSCYNRARVLQQSTSERAEEGDQVGLVLLGEADVEAGVVEVDDGVEVGGEAIVKVGSAGGEGAEHRALEAADVGPLSVDHRAARVGDLDGLAGGLVAEGVERHVGGVARGVDQADVER